MLKPLFEWLDVHPGSYWALALASAILLVARLGILIGHEARGPAAAPARGSTWRDALVLFLFLLAWRWPFLLIAGDFNPDESQQIAGALTLVHDPVFWRSVDGNTSGPLNFYALLPIHWLGAPLDYFTARMLGLLLIWGALFLCLRTLAGAYGRAAAWLGILPTAAFFATVTQPDLIHYSTEHLPLLLMAAIVWLLAGRTPSDRVRLWIACFVAGSLPWTKLQTAPIGLALIGWAGWQVLRTPGLPANLRRRQSGDLILAAALPTLLWVGVIVATGQTEAALHRFLLNNFLYVAAAAPFAKAMRAMLHLAMGDGRFPLLLATATAVLLAAAGYFIIRRIRPSALLVVGGFLTVTAAAAVAAPRREYLHYLLLVPVPLTIWVGAALGGWWTNLQSFRARLVLAGVLVAVGLLPVITRCFQPPPVIYGQFAYNWRHPRTSAAVLVHALAGRDDSLGLWGWANNLYVESGLPQATRDATSVWAIPPNSQQDYHRTIYLADLRRSHPAVFVDAVGIGAFCFENRALQAHEIFPELADYIRQNYTLVSDLQSARVYARNGLATLPELNPVRVKRLIAQGRGQDRFTPPPVISTLNQLQRKFIAGRMVTMVLPPVRLEWLLDEDVREVSLEFGFDPVAYEQGQSNGAEIILELVCNQYTRVVYRRFLDPAHQPLDRGLQTARVTLPPFNPDTHLVLRTDPGPENNNAWDWLYFANLQFRRNPVFLPQQFPGFNRVPDTADAGTVTIAADGPEPQFNMDAPGALAYALEGQERQLSFDYGFRPGSYSAGGRTDGAIYRVELQGAGQPRRVIFERFLQPVSREADRGPQHADLALPAHQPGEILTLSIDPGPAGNNAWDWTYVSNFILK